MKLTIHLEKPGCGDGMYEIRARGYLAAELFWSNEKGILEEYSSRIPFSLLQNNSAARYPLARISYIPSPQPGFSK